MSNVKSINGRPLSAQLVPVVHSPEALRGPMQSRPGRRGRAKRDGLVGSRGQAEHVPQSLHLPSAPPSPGQIRDTRQHAGFTREHCAEVCGVTLRMWARWESGASSMPVLAWAWFRVVASGGFVAGGDAWAGWRVWRGLLYNADGWGGFSPEEIHGIPVQYARIAALEKRIRDLEAQLMEARETQPGDPLYKAQCELETVRGVMFLWWRQYKESENPVLKLCAEQMYHAATEACRPSVTIAEAQEKSGRVGQ